MATLELSIQDEAASAPVRGKRKLGFLFWLASGWVAIILALAILLAGWSTKKTNVTESNAGLHMSVQLRSASEEISESRSDDPQTR